MGDALRFTVCTPTRNRAYILPEAYASLCAQTCRSFEWIVVDDGSQDDTGELVRHWQQEADFPIRLVRHAGRGKHVALNAAVSLACGELFAILDDDDICVPHALERFWHHWETLPPEQRKRVSTITGLCKGPDGKVLAELPSDVLDVDDFSTQFLLRHRAERWGVNRTELLRQYPFPTYADETFLAEALIWNRLSARYATRFVNEVFLTKHYQRDGLTDLSVQVRVANPAGSRQYYLELSGFPLPFVARLKACMNYSRFSTHANVPVLRAIRESPRPVLASLTFPTGQVVAAVDRRKMRNYRRR